MTAEDRDPAGERRAVLSVIEADLESYLARDRAAWELNWVRDERFQSIMECGTMQIAEGYEAFRRNVFDAMDAAPEPVLAEVRREKVRIDVRGDLAWASFDEIVAEGGAPLSAPSLSHNVRVLERAGGRWRILFHGCWVEEIRDIDTPAIEVGARCEVLWTNGAAALALAGFGGLAISHGTLRAARPALDRRLRETVARSHELTGFGRFNLAASDGGGGRSVTFPVVLGEDEDGGLLTCRVRVADGRVYVLFGESGDLSRQLEVARVIYSLSEAQTEIVRLIARGRGLAQIAEALGISANTVKTHLRRVFEKTGTGSQIDLLRLLVGFVV